MKKINFILLSLLKIFKMAKGKGISFEKGDKGYLARLLDLLRWFIQHYEVQIYYYIFGFQRLPYDKQKEYMGQSEHVKLRQNINSILVNPDANVNYDIITFDKFTANIYLDNLGIPCIKNEALIYNELVHWVNGNQGPLSELFSSKLGTFFIKPVMGLGGRGIIKLDTANKIYELNDKKYPAEELHKATQGNFWVLQREILQHPILSAINPHAVNCLRINTVLNRYIPEFMSSFMKFGTGLSAADNWEKGSLIVGIDHENAKLLSYGYGKPKFFIQEKHLQHPDTGKRFKDQIIPFYKEAVDICLKAHRYLYGNFILGWDVAITKDGPLVLEANCEPIFNAQQMLYGGYRNYLKDMEHWYEEYQKHRPEYTGLKPIGKEL